MVEGWRGSQVFSSDEFFHARKKLSLRKLSKKYFHQLPKESCMDILMTEAHTFAMRMTVYCFTHMVRNASQARVVRVAVASATSWRTAHLHEVHLSKFAVDMGSRMSAAESSRSPISEKWRCGFETL
eukprot:6485239-Amphidinium_carterae.1